MPSQNDNMLLCLITNAGLRTVTRPNGTVIEDLNESYMVMHVDISLDDYPEIQIGSISYFGSKILISDSKANQMWDLGNPDPAYIAGPASITFIIDPADPNSIDSIMEKFAILTLMAGRELPNELKGKLPPKVTLCLQIEAAMFMGQRASQYKDNPMNKFEIRITQSGCDILNRETGEILFSGILADAEQWLDHAEQATTGMETSPNCYV